MIYPLVKYFFGHRIIAGHLNAVSEAITTERLPLDLLKTMDKETLELFPTFAHYKERELEASNSVKQLYQRISDSVNLFDGVTSREWYRKFVAKASSIYLSYISAACVAQIFVKPSQMQEKTLSHSIGVFFRNWQLFLVDMYRVTSKTLITLMIMGIILVASGITLTVLIAGANIMTVVLGIVMGTTFTSGIKDAFIDPVQIIKAMKTFSVAETADTDEPGSYAKMAVLSPAYTKLWKKAGGVEVDQAIARETSIIQNEE